MARKRDWVDYGNLAANVAQTAQLGSLNSKMRQLAAHFDQFGRLFQ